MLKTIELYFLLFISYSIIGWTIEVLGKLYEYHRFINRGFLIGPYCPIYGYGGLLITILLQKYSSDPLLIFILGILICSILEYLTSYFMEKIFKARWWDYSQRKYNINGRICLNTMIPFGLLGLVMIYAINPFLNSIYTSFTNQLLSIISIVLFVIFITDYIVSVFALNKIKGVGQLLEKDNTEEMSKRVRELLASIDWRQKRLINAFPTAKYFGTALKENFDKARNKIEAKQNQIINETNARIQLLRDEYDYRVNQLKQQSEDKINKLMNKKEK